MYPIDHFNSRSFVTSLSFAADMVPIDQGYDWSGPYIGLHAGYLTSNTDVTDLGVLVESNANIEGFVGGALVGYNLQKDSLLFGIEADLGWSAAKGSGIAVNNANQYELNWDGHARVRLGVAPGEGQFLLYVAGGLAVADFKLTVGDTGQTKSDTYVGTSIGAGAEYAFNQNMSARIEYIYDNYKNGVFGAKNWIQLDDYSAKLKNSSIIRAAINYKF